MAERFTKQRCQDCQGGLIYNKAEKYWECPYCGKIYERELRFNKVQIDGLAGINDLVRSTLSKLISLDFSGAEKDLLECEKIDHACVGTLIAKISVPLFKSFFVRDRQQELSKVNTLLQKFNKEFPSIEDSEEILYEFIDSADIYSLLMIVYSATGHRARLEHLLPIIEFGEVYNVNVAKVLIGVLLKDGKIEEADLVLQNFTQENARIGISSVLNNYPSNANKALHIERLLVKLNGKADMSKTFDQYFESTADENNVVVEIFLSAAKNKVEFDASKVISSVLARCQTVEEAERIFNALSAKRLDTQTAKVILDWCINDCENDRISEFGFKSLFNSNSIFEIEEEDIVGILHSQVESNVKLEKIKQVLSIFKISKKALDGIIETLLLAVEEDREFRKNTLEELLKMVDSVQLGVFERYVKSISLDGENKPEIIRVLMKKSRNVSLFSTTLSEYMKTVVDTKEVRDNVMLVFLNANLAPDANACTHYLLNHNELHSDAILLKLENMNVRPTPTAFDKYLQTLPSPEKYNGRIAKLLTKNAFSLSASSFKKFLLEVTEPESRKVASVTKFLPVCAKELAEIETTAKIEDITIQGNIAQVYLFSSKDDLYVCQEVIKLLDKHRIRVDDSIENRTDGKRYRFRKFVDEFEDKFSQKIITLLKEIK